MYSWEVTSPLCLGNWLPVCLTEYDHHLFIGKSSFSHGINPYWIGRISSSFYGLESPYQVTPSPQKKEARQQKLVGLFFVHAVSL